MAKFSNQLTDAELERLAILSEEMGEAQQVIGKIIRHGYESFDPARSEEMFIETKGTNRCDLEKELGDVLTAVEFMVTAKDVREMAIQDRGLEKRQKIKKYLHHQLAPAPSPGVTSEPRAFTTEGISNVLSKLESQILRNPDLPEAYLRILHRGYVDCAKVNWITKNFCNRHLEIITMSSGPCPFCSKSDSSLPARTELYKAEGGGEDACPACRSMTKEIRYTMVDMRRHIELPCPHIWHDSSSASGREKGD